MDIYIASPNTDTLLTPDLTARLYAAGALHIAKTPGPLRAIPGLYDAGEKRILALDPDYCDWDADHEAIAAIPNLTAVCLQTTSFSWVDGAYLAARGIPVMNLRGFSTEAVAEWAMLMALAIARRIPDIAKDDWKEAYGKRGIELAGRTAGIVGLGTIGTRIGELATGFGMRVQYWSRTPKPSPFSAVSLPELMRTSDIIFPAMAQNAETQGLITDELLESMRPNTLFVSVVHTVYNHDKLLAMVRDGKLFGYAFEENGGGKFAAYGGNVWAGPAMAWCTEEGMRRNAEHWTEAIERAARGEYPTQVNGRLA